MVVALPIYFGVMVWAGTNLPSKTPSCQYLEELTDI